MVPSRLAVIDWRAAPSARMMFPNAVEKTTAGVDIAAMVRYWRANGAACSETPRRGSSCPIPASSTAAYSPPLASDSSRQLPAISRSPPFFSPSRLAMIAHPPPPISVPKTLWIPMAGETSDTAASWVTSPSWPIKNRSVI